MPELQSPPSNPSVSLEDIRYVFAEQTPERAEALELVNRTFTQYSSGRVYEEERWKKCERLYHAVVDKRYWPGTKEERASLPVPIAFDQIEAAYPIITEALFEYFPTFFDVLQGRGATKAQASEIRDILASWLETPFDTSGITAVTHLYDAVKQGLMYGDCAIELSWDSKEIRPIVEWLDVRDLYISPAATGCEPEKSPAVVRRRWLTVEQIRELKDVDGFSCPPDPVLNHLAKTGYFVGADQVRVQQASATGNVVSFNLEPDPRHQLIEVLQYWTKDRMIWVLGRCWTALNEKNPYGFIPFCKASFIKLLGRPWGLGMPNVLEGDQTYAQGIRNARIDNLALIMGPPRTRSAGTPGSSGKLQWRPNMIDEIASPKDNVVVHQIDNVTADAFREEEVIHRGADRRMGVNAMAQSGIPVPSNANRSATGVNQQASASTRRLRTFVKAFEDYIIVPMLYKMHWMAEKFAPEAFEVEDVNGGTIQAGRDTFSARMRYQMQASTRMVVRDRLAMFLGPISQLLFNEAVLTFATKMGKTLDFGEWIRFFQDATATSKTYQFFRDMTEDEQQKAMQPSPEQQMQMMMKQQDQQTRVGIAQMKAQNDRAKIESDHETKTNATAEASALELLAQMMEGYNAGTDTGREAGGSSTNNRSRASGSRRKAA